MKLTKEMLIDWIDRPPSNSDLDLINYIIDLQNNKDKAIEYLYHCDSGQISKEVTDVAIILENILKGDSDE